MSGIALRWMVRRDMVRVLEIEQQSFVHPWSEEDFLDALRQRNCKGFVAERAHEHIEGFMLFEQYRGHIEILNLAVAPESRFEGIGSFLVGRAADKVDDHPVRNRVVARASERNDAAHLFYRACGFACVGIEHDYYTNGVAAYRFEHRPGLPFVNRSDVGALPQEIIERLG